MTEPDNPKDQALQARIDADLQDSLDEEIELARAGGLKAKEEMLHRTHIAEAPQWLVETVDKKRARLNCISHLLTQIPCGEVRHEPVLLPARIHDPSYRREKIPTELYVPDRF
jgi:hypothetical protein